MMVETSLILMVFLLMVFSIFDFGQVLFLHQSITERVRDALRYGTVNRYDADAIRNYVMYGTAAPVAGAVASYSLTADMVTVQRSDAGSSGDRITITVQNYPFVFISPLVAGQKSGAAIIQTLPYEGD